MARIPLRSYHHEIENLIDRGQIEEAIAHSKNILKQYPKNIETYRLLGKAYLESQRYSEASDILQRLLSVVPDDFVSQLGMSVIREDEGNLDASIWHMERAYEVQPFNRAVQDELRRLYGRRDGAEPPRIRLTRGSLVRMYARGDLYSQAIAESRAALAEDHHRLDLQVLLAQMYYLSGQKVEAAEIASSLIGKLPYCLDANRILMEILPATSRAEEARVFQHRVYDLDPYAEFVNPNTPTSAQVPEQAVMVERVDWQPTMQESQSPDWTRTIGVKWEDDKEENLPDWLNTFGTSPAAPGPVNAAPVEKQEIIPDFMRDAGWSQSETAVEVPPSPMGEVEDESVTGEEELEQVNIPDWLKDMAPQSNSAENDQEDKRLDWLDNILPVAGVTAKTSLDQPDEITPEVESPSLQADPSALNFESLMTPMDAGESGVGLEEPQEIPDFLTALQQPVPPETSDTEDATPDWLKDFSASEQALPPVEDEVTPQGINPSLEESPAWLSAHEPAAKEDFSWLQADQIEAAQPANDLPAWLREEPSENPAVVEDIPAWLNDNEVPAEQEKAALDQTEWINEPGSLNILPTQPVEEPSSEDLSNWLDELKNADAEPGVQQSLATEPSQEAEIPSWLASSDEEDSTAIPSLENQSSSTPIVGEDIPAWMPDNLTEPLPPSTAEEPAQTNESASNSGDMDLDSAMAWLEALAAKQGADEDSLKITSPELRSETPPDWISGYTTPTSPAETEEPAPVEDELPAWLVGETNLETEPQSAIGSNQEPAASVEETVASGEEIPAWSLETGESGWSEAAESQEVPSAFHKPLEQEPEVTLPPDFSEPPAEEKTQPVSIRKPEETSSAPESNLDEIESAMAWMEALAAKQGAEAESLKITSLEDRSETPPDWIASLGTAEEKIQEGEEAAPPAVQSNEEPVLPAWKPEEEILKQPEVTTVSTPTDEIPDWLKGLDSEETAEDLTLETPEPPAAQTETGPDWLHAGEETLVPAEPPSAWTSEPETSLDVAPLDEEIQPLTSAEDTSDSYDMDSALAWLEGLAAKQGADADSLKITTPDQRSETPPDWIAELSKNQPPEQPLEPPAVAETPSSIDEMPAGVETPQAVLSTEAPYTPQEQPQAPEAAETEIPSWLLNYEQEQNLKAKNWEAPQAAQPAPVQASATDDSITLWLKRHHPETGELKSPAVPEENPNQPWPAEEAVQPSPAESPLTEAHTAITRGNIPEAVTLYTQMIKSGDHLDIVINDLREALDHHPQDADIWQTLGDAHIRANRIQDALDAYTKAEELLR